MRLLSLLTTSLALGSFGTPAAPPGGIYSHLLIESGKQFVLEGNQPGVFQVQGRHADPALVAVHKCLRTGHPLQRAVLAPSMRADLVFAAGS